MADFSRYSKIKTHMKRELLLLQGYGCKWEKCTFCDYYNDTSNDTFAVNKPIIDQITGEYAVVDVINSGSIFEIAEETLIYLRQKLYEKKVKVLWCEAHWMYHKRLDKVRKFFEGVEVKFRIGIETFDIGVRRSWKKGIPASVDVKQIATYFQGACFLVGVEGQTKDMILKDIELAKAYFEYFNVNVFVENTTDVKRDENLIKWFVREVYPKLEEYEYIEVLIDNTDLGVG